jgi:hypothetical protein
METGASMRAIVVAFALAGLIGCGETDIPSAEPTPDAGPEAPCPSGQTCGFVIRYAGQEGWSCDYCEQVNRTACGTAPCEWVDVWYACLPPDANQCEGRCCLTSKWGGGILACTCQ